MNSNDRNDDMSFEECLADCIRQGQNEEATRILQEMDSCELTSSISGKTLLHVAADSDNKTVAQHLIDRGCKVDVVDNNGNTPLMLACQQDYTDVIKVLIEAKASVLISNHEGKCAADIVLGGTVFATDILDLFLKRVREECSNDSLRTAKELLRVGCSLTRAMRLEDTAITKYMLENGCDINYKDDSLEGMTPLHQALDLKDNENAKLLIEHGADMYVEDDLGVTPISYANNIDILEFLLDKGARIVDDNGTLIAESLFYCKRKEVVEMLISRYDLTDLSIKDREGTTLFHYIVSNVKFDPVEILQKHFDDSIDINQKDHEGETALLRAVEVGNIETVEFLLKRGAKLDASEDLDSEVFYAVQCNPWKENREDREKMLLLLLQYGADIHWIGEDDHGDVDFALDYVLKRKDFAMVKIILARLALVEDLGDEIEDLHRERIENYAICKKYFVFCKQTIKNLKKRVINGQVTLFDFMTCSEEKLVNFARSKEFVATVHSMVYGKRHSNLYYYKVLRLRVKKAVDVVVLRKKFFSYINFLIPELLNNQIIIEKIVEYIVYEKLDFMAGQPTFKCIIENE